VGEDGWVASVGGEAAVENGGRLVETAGARETGVGFVWRLGDGLCGVDRSRGVSARFGVGAAGLDEGWSLLGCRTRGNAVTPALPERSAYDRRRAAVPSAR